MPKKYEVKRTVAWVSESGEYGGADTIVLYNWDDLTEAQQRTLDELSEYDRIEYVMAALDGDDLSEWED